MNLKQKLHLAQQEIYYGQLIDLKSPIYNMGGYAILTGDLDIMLFKSVVKSLSSVYDTYNFKYDFTQKEPMFYVDEVEEVYLKEIDFSQELYPEKKAKAYMQEGIDTAFDLKKKRLYKYSLIKIKDNIHWWCCYNHHLLYDGFSSAIMVSYVIEEYDRRLSSHKKVKLEKFPTYVNVAKESNSYLDSKQYLKDAIYWKDKFSIIPKSIVSINKKNREAKGKRFSVNISKSDRELFNRLTKNTEANLQQLTIAALLLYYGKTTDNEVFSFGIPVHNRSGRRERKTLGMFSGVLPFRGRYEAGEIVSDFINAIRQTQRNDYRHRQYPLSHLNRALKLLSKNRKQIFDIVINYEPFPFPKSLTSGLGVTIKHLSTIQDLEDPLSFRWCDYGEDSSLILNVDYLQTHFEDSEIKLLVERLLFIIRQFEKGLAKPLREIPILPESEKNKLINKFNDTKFKYPKNATIVEVFELQALKTPDNIAVIYQDKSITYEDLNQKSNQLAHYINTTYKESNNLIGICVSRGIDMIISVLGVLKSCKAYVAIDPNYPPDRIKHILKDSGLDVLITTKLDNTFLDAFEDLKKIVLDVDLKVIKHQFTSNLKTKPNSSDPAYIIYTSGTTGKPKGVEVKHLGVLNIALSWRSDFEVDSDTCLLQLASYTFDVFVGDLCKSLLFGGKMIICPYDLRLDIVELYDLIRTHQITILETTPSLGVPLMDYIYENKLDFSCLKQVILGSDILHIHDFKRLYKRFAKTTRITNSYGVTEATIDSSFYEAKNLESLADCSHVPIGKPMRNTQFYILNSFQELVPQGVEGELYIGGLGVANSYINKEQLTKSKFVSNPFNKKEKLYKTGDLARWLSDGNVDFIGRKDSQVKIRGYRIELGEIEKVLFEYNDIVNCCVLPKEDTKGNINLIGYVVLKTSLKKEAVKSFLRARLPDYMIPTFWIELEKIPLTTNGKVDKKILLQLDDVMFSSEELYVPPKTKIEKQLMIIFQELLGTKKIGTNTNFFELGGHSLLVVQLIAHLHKVNLSISVKDIFEDPTIAGISERVVQSKQLHKVPVNGIQKETNCITPSMVPLLSFDQKDLNNVVDKIKGGVTNIQDMYPLSPLQEGIYFHHLMSDTDEGDPYILPHLLTFNNSNKRTSFVKALQLVVNRHDVLRTCIISEGIPHVIQVVLREAILKIEALQIDNSKNILSELERLIAPGNQWMDITKAPLLELKTIDDLENEQYHLVLLEHHLILDHVGIDKIISEIKIFLSDENIDLPKPALYRDFISHTVHEQATNNSESYFKKLLGTINEPTYPFGLSSVLSNGSDIKEAQVILPPGLSREIRRISIALGMSPAVIFHAAYGIIVGKCSNKNYAVFGSLFSGRLQGTLASVDSLGLFINTLPFYVALKGSVLDYIQAVEEQLSTLLSYEQTPLSNIQTWSGIANEVPLFSALLNFRHSQPPSKDKEIFKDLGISNISSHERTNYPLTLNIDDYGEDFGLTIQVQENIDEDRMLKYMYETLNQLLEGLSTDNNILVNDITILPQEEKVQLLETFNATCTDYSQDKTLLDLFTEQVVKTPDAIAVVYENEKLTFKELDKLSNQLAHYLIEQGTTPGLFLGICIERSLEMLVGIIGILKTGGAYVPIDPDYPQERIAYMLADAQINLVLSSTRSSKQILKSKAKVVVIDLDEEWKRVKNYSSKALNITVSSQDLAYVIYTSGSTGEPKGVMNQHNGIVNRLLWMRSEYQITSEEVILQKTTFSFDVSVWELLLGVISGAKLVFAKPDGHKDANYLKEIIAKHNITTIHFVPSMLRVFLEEITLGDCSCLRRVICSGEVLQVNHVVLFNKKFKGVELHNLYGPTEAAIDVSHWEVPLHSSISSVLIGKPVANTNLYVLNETMNLVPLGVVGELYIGGVQVARGYCNKQELTEQRFISSPFKEHDRLYKTGDLVKWLPDGTIEYIGREDNQVKIRGYRIELGEIEKVLSSVTSVNQCCVLVKEDTMGGKRLVGYVTIQGKFSKEEIQSQLKESLPEYMVPTLWIELEHMPLTVNGKLNRKLLPDPDNSQLSTRKYVAPRNETEELLVAIWQQLLGVEKIGIYDNFFELGGHSLLVTRMVSTIRKEFNMEVTIKNIFKFTTIDEIVCYLEHKQHTYQNEEKEYNINIEI